MRGTKYLSELLEDYVFDQNTLVISPTGSGKTRFILNHLCKDKKTLYLCDNNNLEYQVLLEPNTRHLTTKIIPDDLPPETVHVMTYHRFGGYIDRDVSDDFINQFDIVIADEIHNLIHYYSMDKDIRLHDAINGLLRQYPSTIVAMFTATPHHLIKLKEQYPNADSNFYFIDFTYDNSIIRYINKRETFISHLSHISNVLCEYYSSFSYGNTKCMIYTNTVANMKKVENMCLSLMLSPICLWSINKSDIPMLDEQLKVRKHLLETGDILQPYNVLIINKAMDTGVNITDPDVQLVVVHTNDPTEQIQARGRVRHDVDLLTVKTKDISKLEFITIPKEWHDIWLSIEQLKNFIAGLNLKNKDGHLISVDEFCIILESKLFTVVKKRKKIKGVSKIMYCITPSPFR
jgi:hypothetical protein